MESNKNQAFQPQEQVIQYDENQFQEFYQNYQDNINLPNVFVLGATGVGKSSTCNTLSQAQDGNEFKVSYGTDSCTDEVRFRKVYWKNSLDQLFIIDSPGLNDSKYRDPQIIAKLAVIMKEIKKIDAILVVLDSNNIRFTESLQQMLLAYQDIFGSQFAEKVAFIFTHWSFDLKSQRDRIRKHISQGGIQQEMSQKFYQLLQIDKSGDDPLPCFFLDNMIGQYNINNEEELLDFTPFEIAQMIKSVREIREFVEKDQFQVPEGEILGSMHLNIDIISQEKQNFQQNEKEQMIHERKKELTYKPFLYGFTALNFLAALGLGIANIAWCVIVKVPNPVLLDAFYISLASSSVTGTASGVDVVLDNEQSKSKVKSEDEKLTEISQCDCKCQIF